MAVVTDTIAASASPAESRSETIAFLIMVAVLVVAPFFVYPLFLMQALCFALFACAFNLLIGYVGLLSFGHALYFGWASYLSAHSAKVWGFPPELAILDRHADRSGPRHRRRRARDPPPGHLFRDDHARARADDVLLRACRRSSPAARTASSRCRAERCSASSTSPIRPRCTSLSSLSFWPASCSSTGSSIRPSARC